VTESPCANAGTASVPSASSAAIKIPAIFLHFIVDHTPFFADIPFGKDAAIIYSIYAFIIHTHDRIVKHYLHGFTGSGAALPQGRFFLKKSLEI
jgi:hypothetical protein